MLGALFGLAGSVVPSASLRSLAWGLDGTLLVVAAALAAGFLVFLAGQTLVVSGSAMSLESGSPLFAAGAALWAAALLMISAPRIMPALARISGTLAAVLFASTALQIFAGGSLTPLSQPLPFYAYPLLVVTLLTWASWSRKPTP